LYAAQKNQHFFLEHKSSIPVAGNPKIKQHGFKTHFVVFWYSLPAFLLTKSVKKYKKI